MKNIKDKFKVLIIVILFLNIILGRNFTATYLIGILIVWGTWVCYPYIVKTIFKNTKNLKKFKIKNTSVRKFLESQISNNPEKVLALHISYRISDKLKLAYPDAKWDWTNKNDKSILSFKGGSCYINTENTGDFNMAFVTVDNFARLTLKMMKTVDIECMKKEDEVQELKEEFDVSSWYDEKAQNILNTIILSLQAQGHKELFVEESGDIYAVISGKREKQNIIEDMIEKKYWDKFIKLITNNYSVKAYSSDDTIKIELL